MKFLKNQTVAVIITLIVIFWGFTMGVMRRPAEPPKPSVPAPSTALDPTLSTAQYETWLWDEAGVLSATTEKELCLYNANWDQRYGRLVAVAAVLDTDGQSIDDYTYDLAYDIELSGKDALLVMDIGGQDAYLAVGDDLYGTISDATATSYLDQYLYDDFMAGRYDDGVLALFAALHDKFVSSFGSGLDDRYSYGDSQNDSEIGMAIALMVDTIVLLAVFSAIDSARYSSYRQRYYGMATPPYLFRPILFWHGPNYGWYRRRWHRPPPPPPGGPWPPYGSGSGSTPSRGGGFHSSTRSGFSGKHGGGFSSGGSRGGGSRGGGFSSGSRGGGFSGGSRGGRSGGFGGGSSRGGGFRGGGSRGGGFGGRR